MARPDTYDQTNTPLAVAAYISHCQANNYLPTIDGLSVDLSVARQTLYDWSDPDSDRYHEEFSDRDQKVQGELKRFAVKPGEEASGYGKVLDWVYDTLSGELAEVTAKIESAP